MLYALGIRACWRHLRVPCSCAPMSGVWTRTEAGGSCVRRYRAMPPLCCRSCGEGWGRKRHCLPCARILPHNARFTADPGYLQRRAWDKSARKILQKTKIHSARFLIAPYRDASHFGTAKKYALYTYRGCGMVGLIGECVHRYVLWYNLTEAHRHTMTCLRC